MRLGVFGGTFVPIHVGHFALVERLMARFGFDRFMFVPAHVPPHKQSRRITHPCHRVAMLALATDGHEELVLSTTELDSDPPHYTVDTVAKLHARYPEADPIYFVMGADSFEDLPLWRDYLRLVESCNIIVTARPGYDLDADHLPEDVRQRIVDLRETPIETPVPEPGEGERTRIYLTADSFVDLSSTEVRERARDGRSLDGLVPGAVADYISKQELYSEHS